jgi:hypothetical protein
VNIIILYTLIVELVDILEPPTFKKSGKVKTITDAWDDQDWIGTFNLWIIQRSPVPSVVYQLRSPKAGWAPNKLDVTAGGHYSTGEEILDGLREVREELGKNYKAEDLTHLGRRLNVSPDTKGRIRQNVVEIFMIEDNSSLNSYKLQGDEVYAICSCPIDELIKIYTEKKYTFGVKGLNYKGDEIDLEVNIDSFPYNWDNYLYKIVLLADKFLKKEKDLIY